ncbi:MAG: hypothetical protein HXY19_02340 [Thermoanaerobaculaceae bacterium]|nr:hypothetical protein [Thermoanaerobaculaceae bacterium]
MLTGFNTDIECEGTVYHVQTEDRSGGVPLIESLIYMKGEILAARRTEYRHLLEAGADMSDIQALMERQHRVIVETIRNGRIDILTEPQLGSEGDTTVSRRPPLVPPPPAEKAEAKASKSLDEVISEWLAEQQRVEQIQLQVVGAEALRFGSPFTLLVEVRSTPGGRPVAGVRVAARFLSTASKATDLVVGETDARGSVELAGTIPPLDKGTGLIVVAAQHGSVSDEAKFLVQR